MSLQEECKMLQDSITIIKQKMAHATCKRDYLLLKDNLRTLRTELAMCQADMRCGYSVVNMIAE